MRRFIFLLYMIPLTVAGCDQATEPLSSQTQSLAESGNRTSVGTPQENLPKVAAAASQTLPVADPPSSATVDHANLPTNRLAKETSPYLRMHMHNPVDWYAWGPEAFAKAKQENKVVFLSVGYSSCYWCHVMERESFMDEEIAAFLNEHFVCVKVDREERPDVDAIYMLAVRIMTRRGGWPMSVFMTPDAKPFFGGSYFPARDGDRRGATGFLTILKRLHEVWRKEPDPLRSTADQLTAAIQSEMAGPTKASDVALDDAFLQNVKSSFAASFDDRYGGFGFNPAEPQTPKFPEASNLMFLLSGVEKDQDSDCLRMLTKTLDQMAMGGIWDHVGGGFHRYSVDRFWRIPHFEKMLYDNGQLLSVYSRAYKLTGKPSYRRVVDQTIAFMVREMKAQGGAYISALDAESEKVEGKFYRWEKPELQTALGADFSTFATIYGVDGEPNFEHEYYVVQLQTSLAEHAASMDDIPDEATLDQKLQPLRDKLLAVRNQRVRPLADEKILCSWNGLAIRGLADAGRFCNQPTYTALAAEAAEFVLKTLRRDDGRLLRTYTAGEAKLNAYLDDYAFLIDGLIALHQATGEQKWLQHADRLTKQQIELYGDVQRGGFFFTTMDHETLIARSKNLTDSAQPAGNSLSASNLAYLAKSLGNEQYATQSDRAIRIAAGLIQKFPRAAPRMAAVIGGL